MRKARLGELQAGIKMGGEIPGIFLFLLGISLLGWLKVLNGEICSVTTLAHQKYHVNLKIHRKKKPHFIGVIAIAFGNLQVCYSALEILSLMHIWRGCYPALALILSWDMWKSNYHHSLLDSFAKEEWQLSQGHDWRDFAAAAAAAVHKGQWWCYTTSNAQDSLPQQRIIWSKMLVVPKLRNSGPLKNKKIFQKKCKDGNERT